MIISVEQIRAARALLSWSQNELSERAGINKNTVAAIETGKNVPHQDTYRKIVGAIESAGIEFLEHDGVRKRPTDRLLMLKGTNGLREFYDDVYDVAKNAGGNFCIFNGVPDLIVQSLGSEFYDSHSSRMSKVKGNFNFKVIIEQGDTNFIGAGFAEYKWFPKKDFHQKTIYIYGDKVAFLSWEQEPFVIIIQEKEIAQSQRILFRTVWDAAENIPP